MKINISQIDAATAALARYTNRQARAEHPEGSFDKAGRWYPSGRDEEVMGQVRTPSRSHPTSYNKACRSLAHCERYEGADHDAVLFVKRYLKSQDLSPTSPDAAAMVKAHVLDKALPKARKARTTKPRL